MKKIRTKEICGRNKVRSSHYQDLIPLSHIVKVISHQHVAHIPYVFVIRVCAPHIYVLHLFAWKGNCNYRLSIFAPILCILNWFIFVNKWVFFCNGNAETQKKTCHRSSPPHIFIRWLLLSCLRVMDNSPWQIPRTSTFCNRCITLSTSIFICSWLAGTSLLPIQLPEHVTWATEDIKWHPHVYLMIAAEMFQSYR